MSPQFQKSPSVNTQVISTQWLCFSSQSTTFLVFMLALLLSMINAHDHNVETLLNPVNAFLTSQVKFVPVATRFLINLIY